MEKLDSYQKYLFRVEGRGLSRLIENIAISVNMALLQSQRILEDNASLELPRVNPGPDQVLFLILFADIHFYLVSVDNIRKSIDRLDKALEGRLTDLKNSYREFFDSIQELIHSGDPIVIETAQLCLRRLSSQPDLTTGGKV